MGDVREALAEALFDHDFKGTVFPDRGTAWISERSIYLRAADALAPVVDDLIAHARAQALRDAAEHLPEVGDVLRGMAAREVGE